MMTEVAAHQSEIRFYTTGCAGKNINDLKPLLDRLDAILVDVRFSPTSEIMFWRQVYLKTLLRGKYHYVAQLGNRAFRNEGTQVQHLDLGIKILVSFNANALLMCECADPEQCHRLIIARELCRKGFDTEELVGWKSI